MGAGSVSAFLNIAATDTAIGDRRVQVGSTTTTTGWPGYWTNYNWVPQYWYGYGEDKATVAFRVVKRLIDLKIINEDKLTIKKFIYLVDELVKTL